MDIVPQTMNQLQTGQSVSLIRYTKSFYSLLPQSFEKLEKLQCTESSPSLLKRNSPFPFLPRFLFLFSPHAPKGEDVAKEELLIL